MEAVDFVNYLHTDPLLTDPVFLVLGRLEWRRWILSSFCTLTPF